jgi:hypothetical protein
MSDIVDELRDPYRRAAWASTLCSDAADEIERLRGENEQLKVALLNAASAVTVKEFQTALQKK